MEETGVLWCSSFADGQRRVGPRNDRHRNYLSPLPWFRELLCKVCCDESADCRLLATLAGRSNVLDAWAWQGEHDSTGGVPVTSMFLVASGTSNEGVLTNWNPAEDLQRVFYDYPEDCYSLTVKDAFVLDEPQALLFKQQIRKDLDGLSRISATQPLFRGAWSEVSRVSDLQGECMLTGFKGSVKDVLQAWEVDFNDAEAFTRDTPVVMLPFPLSLVLESLDVNRLLLLARWHTALAMSRWHRRVRGPHLPSHYPGPLLGIPQDDSKVWLKLGCHEVIDVGGGLRP